MEDTLTKIVKEAKQLKYDNICIACYAVQGKF